MSRTYRLKKDKHLSKWVLIDWHFTDRAGCVWYKEYHDAKSTEGKKRLAKHHSDAKWLFYNERGPGWFHNYYSQRPYRRDAKNQLHRYVREEDFEVQLLRKPKREYWT